MVVPVWCDATALERLLATRNTPQDQWVVARGEDDPESSVLDGLAVRFPDVVWVTARPGRGTQLNAGAAAADGDWLVFLHADSSLPSGWRDEVLASPCVWGCFRFALETDAWQARLIEKGVAFRVQWLSLPYGDQGIFVRRDVFQSAGGFPPYPLMEDVALVQRLWAVGPLYRSPLRVHSSARRWQRDGWWRRSLRNLSVLARYALGVPPERLVEPYERPRG